MNFNKKSKKIGWAEKLLDKMAQNKKYKTEIVSADDAGVVKAEKLLSSGQVVAVATEVGIAVVTAASARIVVAAQAHLPAN